MSTETPLSRWLKKELPAHGYPMGARTGSISRLAADAGITQSAASRLIRGETDKPDLDHLYKIGQLLGYTLPEMIVHAGLATAEQMCLTGDDTPTYKPDLQVYERVGMNPDGCDYLAERQVMERITALGDDDRKELSRMAWMLAAHAERRKERQENENRSSNGVRDIGKRRRA